jgi:hypothetical protein
MECGFGYRPYYFGFHNSDQDLLAYQILLMECGFGHRPYYFGFRTSDQDLLAYQIFVTKPTRGIICVGNLDNKMQLDTQQLSPRQSIHLDKMSSGIKSMERADNVPSYNQSVMSDRPTSFAQSWENRNNMDDFRSHISSISSDRQTQFDQRWENRKNMDDVEATSHILACLLDNINDS